MLVEVDPPIIKVDRVTITVNNSLISWGKARTFSMDSRVSYPPPLFETK